MKSLLLGKDSKLGYIQEGVFYTLNSTLSSLKNAIAFFDDTYVKNLLGGFGLFSGGQIYDSQNLLALANDSDIENVKNSIFIALDSTQYKNSEKNIFFSEGCFLKDNKQSIFISSNGDVEKLNFTIGSNKSGRVVNLTNSFFINADGNIENSAFNLFVLNDTNGQNTNYSVVAGNDSSFENVSFSIFTQNQGRVVNSSYILGTLNDTYVEDTKNTIVMGDDSHIDESENITIFGNGTSLEKVKNSLIFDNRSRIEETNNSIFVSDNSYVEQSDHILAFGRYTIRQANYSLFLSESNLYVEKGKYLFNLGNRNNYQGDNKAVFALGNNVYTQDNNGVFALSSENGRGPHIESSERSIIANSYNENVKNTISFLNGSSITNVTQSLIFGHTGYVNNVESCLTLAKEGGNLLLQDSKETISVGGNVQGVEKGIIFDGTIRDSHHIISFNNSWVNGCQYSFIASRDCSNEKLDQCLALFESGAFLDSQKSILLLKNGEVQNLDKSIALIEGGAITNLKNSMAILENAEIYGNVKDSILMGYYDDTMENEAIIQEDEIHFFDEEKITIKEKTQNSQKQEQAQNEDCEELPVILTQELVTECSWGVENAKIEGTSVTILVQGADDYSGLIKKYTQDIIYQNFSKNGELYIKVKLDKLTSENNKLALIATIPMKLKNDTETKDGGIMFGIFKNGEDYFLIAGLGSSDNTLSSNIRMPFDYSEGNSYNIEIVITNEIIGLAINRNQVDKENVPFEYAERSEGTFITIGKTSEAIEYMSKDTEEDKEKIKTVMSGFTMTFSNIVIDKKIPDELKQLLGDESTTPK